LCFCGVMDRATPIKPQERRESCDTVRKQGGVLLVTCFLKPSARFWHPRPEHRDVAVTQHHPTIVRNRQFPCSFYWNDIVLQFRSQLGIYENKATIELWEVYWPTILSPRSYIMQQCQQKSKKTTIVDFAKYCKLM
jgi:hypothetical protein